MTPTSQAVVLFLLCKSLATFREMFAVFKSYLFLHLFFSLTHLNEASSFYLLECYPHILVLPCWLSVITVKLLLPL